MDKEWARLEPFPPSRKAWSSYGNASGQSRQSSAEAYQAVERLDKVVKELTASAGFAEGFVHLLKLRASQINQCAYCVRMHTDALKAGESSDRISLLNAWRESGYFNDNERAALLLTEAVTRIAKGQVPDAVYAEAAGALNEKEIAAVEWLAIVMNTWNRVAITSRDPVKP